MAKSKGRPRKPEHMKVVQGTDRPDRRNDEAPVPAGSLGGPPDRMPKLAGELWAEIGPSCFWLTDADRVAFERFCREFAMYLWCADQVERDGPVQTFKSGAENLSGAATAMYKAQDMMDKIGAGLGLDPASRSKIRTGKKPVENPWTQFKDRAG